MEMNLHTIPDLTPQSNLIVGKVVDADVVALYGPLQSP